MRFDDRLDDGQPQPHAAEVTQAPALSKDNLEVAFYRDYSVDDGRFNNNGWMQEMPDPVSKAVWDNYLTISQAMAGELGIRMAENTTQKVNITVNDQTITVPVLIQPGQANAVGLL